jgi:ribosomal protein S18 acetylase RimI-like enzyme
MIRPATKEDAAAIARVINAAFEVEREFRRGDRTSAAEILALLQHDTFLVDDQLVGDQEGRIAGAVHVRTAGAVGYFGMLAVDAEAQGRGLGRALLEAAEDHCRKAACSTMTLSTGEDRKELIPWYERLGYRVTSTELSTNIAFSRPIRVVHMAKPL